MQCNFVVVLITIFTYKAMLFHTKILLLLDVFYFAGIDLMQSKGMCWRFILHIVSNCRLLISTWLVYKICFGWSDQMNQQLECSKKEHSDDMALKAKAYFVKQIKLWVLIRDAQILLLVLLCHYIVAHTIYFFMLLISNLIKTNCLICFKHFSTRVARWRIYNWVSKLSVG